MPRRKAARGGLTVPLHSLALDPPTPTVEEGAKEAVTCLLAVLARRRGMERREADEGTWRELDLQPRGGDDVELVFRPHVKGARPPTVEEATAQGADPRVSFELAVHPRRRIPRLDSGLCGSAKLRVSLPVHGAGELRPGAVQGSSGGAGRGAGEVGPVAAVLTRGARPGAALMDPCGGAGRRCPCGRRIRAEAGGRNGSNGGVGAPFSTCRRRGRRGGLGGVNSVEGRSRGSAGLRFFASGPYFSSRGWNRGSAGGALTHLHP
jgi:hypothetical protein